MSDGVALSLWGDASAAGSDVARELGRSASAYGKVAELRAIDELLLRGHKVAVPVVDDDGVDLVVDYRLRVQVKNSHRVVMKTNSAGGRDYVYPAYKWGSSRDGGSVWRADFYLLHADDGRSRWWVVPSSFFVRHGKSGQITMYHGSRRGLSAELVAFENRWDLLRG